MATSNKVLNDYVSFLKNLNRADHSAIKEAQGGMDPAMMGGMPMAGGMDPAMMGGGMPMAGGMDPAMMGGMDPAMMGGMDPAMMGGMDPAMMGGMDPAMMGGADPGMAMGIPGGLDPTTLAMLMGEEEEGGVSDKELLAKTLDVSDRALELAQNQTEKLDELLSSLGGGADLGGDISQEELDALVGAKEQAAAGMM